MDYPKPCRGGVSPPANRGRNKGICMSPSLGWLRNGQSRTPVPTNDLGNPIVTFLGDNWSFSIERREDDILPYKGKNKFHCSLPFQCETNQKASPVVRLPQAESGLQANAEEVAHQRCDGRVVKVLGM